MPRLTRKCPPGLPVHVIQRGNNRQVCFASDSDLKACANWLFKASWKFDVSIHAGVFMTNHVHLLMTLSCWSGISRTGYGWCCWHRRFSARSVLAHRGSGTGVGWTRPVLTRNGTGVPVCHARELWSPHRRGVRIRLYQGE